MLIVTKLRNSSVFFLISRGGIERVYIRPRELLDHGVISNFSAPPGVMISFHHQWLHLVGAPEAVAPYVQCKGM